MFDFKKAVAAATETKDLSKVIAGNSGNYLAEGGPYPVTVAAVNTEKLADKGYINVIFESDTGKTHSQNIFVAPGKKEIEEKQTLAFAIRRLFGGLLKAEVVQGTLMEELKSGPAALNLLVSMKLGIVLKRGKGFIVKATDGGLFGAYDSETGKPVTALYPTVDEVKLEAGAKNIRRAMFDISEVRLTHADDNAKRLHASIESRSSAKAGNGGADLGFSAGVKIVGGIV